MNLKDLNLKQPSFLPLSIPIQNIDSLNVAIAGSLLMFQLREAVCK